jgi:phosphate transport system substrate-binding protein
MKKLLGGAAALMLMAGATSAHAARDYIWAAGSSTVFPFATRVAENYARKTGSKAPKVESLGTGGGIKAFCAGVGEKTPDIANASRRMKKSEFDACAAKGVKDIVEIKIGYDGIVIANDKDGSDYNFKLEHLYLGLSDKVLRSGKFVKNPSTSWDEIAAGLPGDRIVVYGPPPSSGTRDSFVELGIEAGAAKYPVLNEMKSNNEKGFKALVDPLRTDGGWIDAGENDNAIVQTLTKTPGAIGVFGFSFLEENMDKVQGAKINGVAPTPATISSGAYPLSRTMYIYVKKAHLGKTPGLQEFVDEFASDAATGKGGYLQSRGLIPLPAGQHDAQQTAAKAAKVMTRPAS